MLIFSFFLQNTMLSLLFFLIALTTTSILATSTQYTFCLFPISSTFIMNCNEIIGSQTANDLFTVLASVGSDDEAVIYLANQSNLPFYILNQDNTFHSFTLKTLIIKPFYCTTFNTTQIITLYCYNDNQMPIIYLKTNDFTIIATKTIQIENIDFDGSELIKSFNDNNNVNLNTCLSTKMLCCPENGSKPFPDITCSQHNQTISQIPQISGLFTLSYITTPLISTPLPQIILTNTTIHNIQSITSLTSFIVIDAISSSLILTNVQVNNTYFMNGFVNIRNSIGFSSCLMNIMMIGQCTTTIVIVDSSFMNVNMFNVTKKREIANPSGYVLSLNTTYYQNITITNTTFDSMLPSTQATCFDSSSLSDPMNILGMTSYKNAYGSNFLLQHVYNHDSLLQNSAILIEILNGTLTLKSNRFKNIVGYSGSILAINKLTIMSNVVVDQNVFDNNFAILNAATIRIITYTENYFEYSQCGHSIMLTNNTFTNNIGCSLAYANVLIICSGWSLASLSSSTYSYSTISLEASLSTQYKALFNTSNLPQQGGEQAQILIQGNIFQSNYLSLSNGIAIHGYPIVNVNSNRFSDNGVLVERFGMDKVMGYSVGNLKPFVYSVFDNINYLESSPLYVCASSYLIIERNTFQNNWNIYSGDVQFGSQITLRDIIVLGEFTQINFNNFTNNSGIPSEIRSFLQDSQLSLGNAITLPLIIFFAFPISNTEFITWATTHPTLNLMPTNITQFGLNITFTNCIFQFNTFSFDFENQSYLADGYLYTMYAIEQEAYANKVGFFKFLIPQELYTLNNTLIQYSRPIHLKFFNTIFTNNTMKTQGCGIFGITGHSFISNNTIYRYNLLYQSVYLPKLASLSQASDTISVSLITPQKYGLICIDAPLLIGKLTLPTVFISNSLFEANQGLIISTFEDYDMLSWIQISQTMFKDNYCNDSSIIKISYSIFNLTSSIFISNRASFGSIILYKSQYQGIQNHFEQSTGYHGSVGFYEFSIPYEISSTFLNNTSCLSVEYTFYQNPTTTQCGGIFLVKTTYFMNHSIIDGNTSPAGFLVLTSSIAYLFNVTMANNTYPSYYPVVMTILAFATYSSELHIDQCEVRNNTGQNSESLLQNIGIFTIISSFHIISNSWIHNNPITDSFSLISAITTIINITNTTIENNTMASNVKYPSELITGNLGFFNYIETNFIGNANIMSITSGLIYIDQCKFINNSQTFGLKKDIKLYVPYKLDISNSIFSDESSSFNDQLDSVYFVSAIESYSNAISNVQFSGLKGIKGAAIEITGGITSIQQSYFQNIFLTMPESSSIIGSDIQILNIEYSSFSLATSISGNNMAANPMSLPSATYLLISSSPNLVLNIQNTDFLNGGLTSALHITQFKTLILNNSIIKPNHFPYQIISKTTPISNLPSLSHRGILTFQNFDQISILNCTFENSLAGFGALNLIFGNANATVDIFNTSFVNNVGFVGGAMTLFSHVNNVNITISNSTFENNTANHIFPSLEGNLSYFGEGGALYFSCDNDLICVLTLNDIKFIKNKASIAGGAIYWDHFPPFNNSGLVFKSNEAVYGPDFGSLPVYIFPLFLLPNSTQLLTFFRQSYDPCALLDTVYENRINYNSLWVNVVSGNRPENTAYAGVYDFYGQLYTIDNWSTLLLIADTNKYSMRVNPGSIQAINGIYNTSELTVDYYPLKNASLILYSTIINMIPSGYIQLVNNTNPSFAKKIVDSNLNKLEIALKFIDCPIGYVFSEIKTNGKIYGICTACSNGSYSLDPQTFQKHSDKQCETCDYDLFDSCVMGYISLKSGYWRMNATADIIMKCQFEDYCPGGMNTTNFTEYICAYSTSNNLCSQCPSGHAKCGNDGSCTDCKADVMYYVGLIGIFILQTGLIAYSVRCIISESKEYDGKEVLNVGEFKSNLIKIMSNYLQLLSVIGSYTMNWPDFVTNGISNITNFSLGSKNYVSLDCFIAMSSTKFEIKETYIKFLGIISIPFAGLIFILIIWGLIFKLQRRSIAGSKEYINKVITTFIVLIYNIQPNLLTNGFMLFKCTNLYRKDNRIFFLNADYTIQCWDNNHLLWALGPGLFILLSFGITIPLIVFWILYKNRDNLNDESIRLRYSFIYKGYRRQTFYWEFLIIIRKFIIITILIFIGSVSQLLQIMSGLGIIIISIALQNRGRPFQNPILNDLELKSLTSSWIVGFSAIYYLNEDNRYLSSDIVMAIVTIFGNLYFVVLWIWQFGFVIKQELTAVKDKSYEIIGKICPCLKRKRDKVVGVIEMKKIQKNFSKTMYAGVDIEPESGGNSPVKDLSRIMSPIDKKDLIISEYNDIKIHNFDNDNDNDNEQNQIISKIEKIYDNNDMTNYAMVGNN